MYADTRTLFWDLRRSSTDVFVSLVFLRGAISEAVLELYWLSSLNQITLYVQVTQTAFQLCVQSTFDSEFDNTCALSGQLTSLCLRSRIIWPSSGNIRQDISSLGQAFPVQRHLLHSGGVSRSDSCGAGDVHQLLDRTEWRNLQILDFGI